MTLIYEHLLGYRAAWTDHANLDMLEIRVQKTRGGELCYQIFVIF